MRVVMDLNDGWNFTKKSYGQIPTEVGQGWERVDLPHTWNAVDGQDGGNDYHRGVCLYSKVLEEGLLPPAERYYLQFKGVNSSADVYIDGEHLGHHDGGYSAWRVDITKALRVGALLVVAVDNSPSDSVYPQMADFTFYGGIYREVSVICVGESHFDLDYWGSEGLMITPTVKGNDARVEIEVFVTGMKEGQELEYLILDADGETVHRRVCRDTRVEFLLKNARLWQGKRDPYLYVCLVRLTEGGEVVDGVSCRFGCRSYSIDPDRGFILNGEEYPLRGVSRHQDREGVGNALHRAHHREDMELICELGATTVRLAHYQHDQYFYDLCDEKGLVVWAEIPYISKHLPGGVDNTLSQLRELILQNYNHPSIVVWGLSNEISIGGSDGGLLENHVKLNELAHSLDPTRSTAVAAVSPCSMEDPYLQIPDAVSYNHYFGWYGGDVSMYGPWFDKFHALHPDIPIGCSEYGCEALDWHSASPTQGDYTEEYQAYYHEELIKQLFSRKYLWATHVWNMFDFGADARAEGGENGRNHKGLVTMDRKYRKDAFYAYKAWLSDAPFVHLCGKRFVDRVGDTARITVYSNQPEVELFVNGKSQGVLHAEDHFFRFEVKNEGESLLTVKAGELTDSGRIRRVEKENPDYILREAGAVLNWFDVTVEQGRFSLNDKISDIVKTEDGKRWLDGFLQTVKRKSEQGGKGSGGFEAPLADGGAMMDMMGGFTVLRLSSMLGMMGASFTKEELLELNRELNSISRE